MGPKSVARIAIVAAWLAGCGAPADEPAAPPEVDEVFATFAAAVRDATARTGRDDACARALPPVAAASARAALDAASDAVARSVGVARDALTMHVVACGGPGEAGCAEAFRRHVARGGGRLAELLHPLARDVERAATAVTQVVWTPRDETGARAPVAALLGLRRGRVLGMAFHDDPVPDCVPERRRFGDWGPGLGGGAW